MEHRLVFIKVHYVNYDLVVEFLVVLQSEFESSWRDAVHWAMVAGFLNIFQRGFIDIFMARFIKKLV